jgi:hypothetical protein
MRIPQFRLSIRHLMIGVGVFGLLLGGLIMEMRRRRDYQERSNDHLQQLEGCPPSPSKGFFFQLPRETQSQLIKSWVYHAMMWEKYQTALKIPFYFLPDEAPE